MQNEILAAAEAYAEALFAGDAGGHDAAHTARVYRTALRLAAEEGADPFVTGLAALLHDTDDRKLFPETAADLTHARVFLEEHAVPRAAADAVLGIIREVSFAGTESVVPSTPEGKCVQDADRLDALGAIGIARAFAYGGAHGRPLYDPADPPVPDMDAAAYRARRSHTVNHFYEKLFLLAEQMNTPAARRLAERRTAFMRTFLDAFLAEWNGADLA